mmetsp:Transcript_47702/g.144238  ORF Transcript_47702/g.144238 Transcript_47702/m.144238 type:complete len:404 (+) Transcript_47702:16-1227(+)
MWSGLKLGRESNLFLLLLKINVIDSQEASYSASQFIYLKKAPMKAKQSNGAVGSAQTLISRRRRSRCNLLAGRRNLLRLLLFLLDPVEHVSPYDVLRNSSPRHPAPLVQQRRRVPLREAQRRPSPRLHHHRLESPSPFLALAAAVWGRLTLLLLLVAESAARARARARATATVVVVVVLAREVERRPTPLEHVVQINQESEPRPLLPVVNVRNVLPRLPVDPRPRPRSVDVRTVHGIGTVPEQPPSGVDAHGLLPLDVGRDEGKDARVEGVQYRRVDEPLERIDSRGGRTGDGMIGDVPHAFRFGDVKDLEALGGGEYVREEEGPPRDGLHVVTARGGRRRRGRPGLRRGAVAHDDGSRGSGVYIQVVAIGRLPFRGGDAMDGPHVDAVQPLYLLGGEGRWRS